MPRPELSLVIPIYNEEEVLPQLHERLTELLVKLGEVTTEVVFVNDGSKDRSIDILRRLAGHEPRYRVVSFSRNFGHQRAITAGMDKSRGHAVVVMDADLQDPPEVILKMIEKWQQGYDVVYGRRRSRAGESWFKLFTAKWFYRVFAALIPIEVPLDTGDFRLMSRRVVSTLRGLRENHRFVRGLVAWVGFKQTAVEYDRAARAAGETKYPLKKMLAFAIDGIASFSIQPLRFSVYVGVFVGTASVFYAIASVITWLAGLNVPGWTTTVVLLAFLFSVQFFMLGVLGEYVGRIYEQVKRRPLYIVSERINFSSKTRAQKIDTQDIEELPATTPQPLQPPAAGRTPSGHMVSMPKRPSVETPATVREPSVKRPAFVAEPTTKPSAPGVTSDVPPPPAAVFAAGAAAEASISNHPPPDKEAQAEAQRDARKSVTPAPPATASAKPPPLKLSSSLSSIPAAPPAPPASVGPPATPMRPSFPSVPPPLPRTPTAPPVGPMRGRVASVPPPLPKTPAAPPVSTSKPPSVMPGAPPASTAKPPSIMPSASPASTAKPPSIMPGASPASMAKPSTAPPKPSTAPPKPTPTAPPVSMKPSTAPPRRPSAPMKAVTPLKPDVAPETSRSPSTVPPAGDPTDKT